MGSDIPETEMGICILSSNRKGRKRRHSNEKHEGIKHLIGQIRHIGPHKKQQSIGKPWKE